MFDGLVEFSGLCEGDGQIVMCFRIFGVESDGVKEVRDGLLDSAAFGKGLAKEVVSGGVFRLELKGALKVFGGLGEAVLLGERGTEVGVSVAEIWFDL